MKEKKEYQNVDIELLKNSGKGFNAFYVKMDQIMNPERKSVL